MLANKSTLQLCHMTVWKRTGIWKWGSENMDQSYTPVSKFIWSEEWINCSLFASVGVRILISNNFNTLASGRSMILGRGVQVQAAYWNSTCCYIVPGKGGRSTLTLGMQNIVEVLYIYESH